MADNNVEAFRDTPSLLVDLDKMEANLKEMADVAADAGVALRPHVKTHKSPGLARLQLDYGAAGITVAKIGEAEVMADAGITDIRIAYPIVGEAKLARLERLMERADVSISLDSIEAARGLSDLGERLGRQIPILLKVNTGLDRVGSLPGQESLRLAEQIGALPGVDLVGLLTHEGHALRSHSRDEAKERAVRAGEAMVQTAELLRGSGFDIREVSVGSTPTARDIAYVSGVTEIRPGTYIFNDLNEMTIGVATEATVALTVLATVVSIPADNRAIIDAGSKTLSTDGLVPAPDSGFGYVRGHPDIRIDHLTEEHGILFLDAARDKLNIGEQLEIIPNHVCPVVNLADVMYGMRRGKLEREIPVSARGKNR
ncbi:MAG: alanine racemase [Chloroflexota bacterium]